MYKILMVSIIFKFSGNITHLTAFLAVALENKYSNRLTSEMTNGVSFTFLQRKMNELSRDPIITLFKKY